MLPFDTWSYSRLSTYQRCPAQFFYRYLEQCPPEETAAALLLGSAVHDAVTLHHVRRSQGKVMNQDDARQSLRQQLGQMLAHPEAPVTFPEAHPDAEATVQMAERLLQTYLAQPISAPLLAVEQSLEAPLAHPTGARSPLALVGVVDRIEQGADQHLVAVELKTAAKAWSEQDVQHNDQITTYAYLLRACGHERVSFRVEVLTKTKTPRLQLVETTRSPEQIDRLVTKFLALERAIQAGAFPTHEGMPCGTCAFRRRCAASPP